MFVLLLAAAIFAPFLSMQNPYDLMSLNILDGNLPPGSRSMDGMVYLLGTDDQGRDVYSALLYGLRTSLFVGLSAAFLAFTIGSVVGLLAAH
ncbi:MAG: ABC transporter permease, partial [Puniceicoccales bacterium]